MGEAFEQLIVEDILPLEFPMMSLRLPRAGMIRGYYNRICSQIGITVFRGESSIAT